jgi:hypothetical protein
MAFIAIHLFGAATFFIAEDLALRPVGALDRIIFVLLGISSIVLSVVGIHALASVMIIDVGAKDRFVFVQVEIFILF